jgi:2-polyprenyl-6-methoxyphenol hydroxylase-like FAD-dependent oxidoreductase
MLPGLLERGAEPESLWYQAVALLEQGDPAGARAVVAPLLELDLDRRAERFRGSADLPGRFRAPSGPGWALVGDAGLVLDPITGQGISDAFRDAELLADAVDAGLGGRQPLAAALAGYQRQRDRASLPMYEFTAQLAALAPPRVEDQVLFASLQGRQAEIDRFFGVVAGSEPLQDYLAPGNLVRVIGVRGMASVVLGRLRAARRPARQPSHSASNAAP